MLRNFTHYCGILPKCAQFYPHAGGLQGVAKIFSTIEMVGLTAELEYRILCSSGCNSQPHTAPQGQEIEMETATIKTMMTAKEMALSSGRLNRDASKATMADGSIWHWDEVKYAWIMTRAMTKKRFSELKKQFKAC